MVRVRLRHVVINTNSSGRRSCPMRNSTSSQASSDSRSLRGLARQGSLLQVRLALAGRARGHQLSEHFLGRPVHRLGQAGLLVLPRSPQQHPARSIRGTCPRSRAPAEDERHNRRRFPRTPGLP
jgi:hypothetical protein